MWIWLGRETRARGQFTAIHLITSVGRASKTRCPNYTTVFEVGLQEGRAKQGQLDFCSSGYVATPLQVDKE